MKKINFIKKVTPLSADTFNQMQNNIEEEFSQVNSRLAEKASQQEVNEKFSQVNSQLAEISAQTQKNITNLKEVFEI